MTAPLPAITPAMLSEVTRAYDSAIIRNYVRVRFQIINIDLIGRLHAALPSQGRILDVGCGFGLFSLLLARACPQRTIHGLDLNSRRLAHARTVARKLKIPNVSFEKADITRTRLAGEYDAIFVLDLLHHISPLA